MNNPVLGNLLTQICSFPDDDMRRLEFAKCAESVGERSRAEIIRLQCELNGIQGDNIRESALVTRCKELLEEHRGEWARELLEICPLRNVGFRRGFVERIWTSAKDFLAHSEEIFNIAPINELEFDDITDYAEGLAGCAYLRRIRHLTIHCRPLHPVGIDDLIQLISSPFLEGLETLYVPCHWIGDSAIELLCERVSAKALKSLGLMEDGIGDQGVHALANCNALTSLRVLNLRGNLITDVGAGFLIDSAVLRELSELHLDSYSLNVYDQPLNPISRSMQEALAKHFTRCRCSFSSELSLSGRKHPRWL